MASKIEQVRTRLRQENAEYDAEIRQFVRGYLTEEELRRRWTRLSTAVEKANATKVSWVDALRERAGLFFGENLFPKVAAFATAAAVIIIGLLVAFPGGPSEIALKGVADPERATAVHLPKNLQLNLKKSTVSFSEGSDRLSGTMALSSQQVPPGISVLAIAVQGKDSAGAEGRFSGMMWLTNASGTGPIKRRKDVAGALVRGSLEVIGQSTNTVDQSFIP